MTHTSTEQPEALPNDHFFQLWQAYCDKKSECEDLLERIAELEAAQAQRVTPEIAKHVNALTEIARMPNAEYVADAHNNAVRYLRGITREKQG